jgi:hypothetical protein
MFVWYSYTTTTDGKGLVSEVYMGNRIPFYSTMGDIQECKNLKQNTILDLQDGGIKDPRLSFLS